MSQEAIVVMVSTADAEAARSLAREVVGKRLAACAQILPIQSCYWWEGTLTESAETLILFKSTAARYVDLERTIREAHAYEVPEIVALPVTSGLPAYLRWLEAETREAES